MAFYNQPPEAVLRDLGSSPAGLTEAEAQARLERDGKNLLQGKKRKSLLRAFLGSLCDRMTIVLFLAAAASYTASRIAGETDYDFIIILAIVFINSVISVYQERRAEKAIEALKKLGTPQALVLRGGQEREIKSEDVVRGDLLLLRKGYFVPADARVLEANELLTDESSLSGESAAVSKTAALLTGENLHLSEQRNMVFSSTAILGGSGKAVAVATGMDTSVGRIAALLHEEENGKTPLQERLARIGSLLGNAALVICALLLVFSLLRGMPFAEMFLTSVSLAVAAIPEGLPAIVTIMLSIGVQKMARHKAIVKHLTSVETLGCASVICSDKTGTLTQNRMTVVETHGDRENLFRLFLLCNDRASPTENALAEKGEAERAYAPEPRVAEVPFDSKRKYMITVHKTKSGYLSVLKGAPDVILPMCRGAAGAAEKASEMAQRALRVLGFAYAETETLPAAPEKLSYTFCGLAGLIDPPRAESYEAVKACRRAGIKVVMITGDHADTAVAVARSIGICGDRESAVTESELLAMEEPERRRAILSHTVFARTTPEFKLRIVRELQAGGFVVAMTGDGVNDAPALKAADIGCAMGKGGTDVAKEASDLILADDNFATIVSAVRQGRGIYENIRRTVHFLLSCNIGEIITVFAAILVRLPSPLAAVQLLWVNLVTDSLPAVALGMEKTDEDVMRRKPIKKGQGMFSFVDGLQIFFEGILIGILSLSAYLIGCRLEGHMTGRTMAFLVLSLSQLFHSYNMRSDKSIFRIGPFSNGMINFSFLLCGALQVAVVLFEPLRTVFGTVLLDGRAWLIVLALSFAPVVVCEIYKALNRKKI